MPKPGSQFTSHYPKSIKQKSLGKKPLQCLELLPTTEKGWEIKEENKEKEAVSHPNIVSCNSFAVPLVLLLLLPMTVITKNH